MYSLEAQPSSPQFTASINALLSKCSPTVPMRQANFSISTIGQLSLPTLPIKIPARILATAKTAFLQNFVGRMKKLDVIEDGHIGDFLSPVHLVQKFDKNPRPVENSISLYGGHARG